MHVRKLQRHLSASTSMTDCKQLESNWLAIEIDEIKLDEGERLVAYKDSLGIPTIGVGHTKGVKMGDVWTKEQSYQHLREDVEEALKDAKAVCSSFDELTGPRKGVILNMSFNLGRQRLAGFKNTLRFINAGNYSQAARNMLLSQWATQVGRRANRLAYRMEHNEYAAR